MKKIIAVILAFVLLLCVGCSESTRFGMQELSRRLAQQDEKYAFSLDNVSLYNEYYHIPFSLVQEEDLLLSCKEDADGNLTQILLTAEKDTAPTADFMRLAELLIAVFFGVKEQNAKALAEEAGMADESVLFTDFTGTAKNGRYSFTFFSTPLSITAILTYDDAVVAQE